MAYSQAVARKGDENVRAITPVAIGVALVGVILGIYLRYSAMSRPGVSNEAGFYGFFDQGSYLRTVEVLARWHLPVTEADYAYGLGYPILAVPFRWLGMDGDPFAGVDVLAYAATLSFTFVLGTRVAPRQTQASMLAVGLGAAGVVGFASPLATMAKMPWNFNVVVPLGLLVLVLATSPRECSWPRAVGLGVAIGWIFSTRYLDALFLGVPVIAMFVLAAPRERKRILVGGGAGLLVIVGLVLATQANAFGSPFDTPYSHHERDDMASNDQSLEEYNLGDAPRHFVQVFITGENDAGDRSKRDPVLAEFPLLVLMPVGAVVLARSRLHARAVVLTGLGASVVGSIFYLSFVAGGGNDLEFGNIRYWAPWFPLWATLSVVAIAATVDWAITKTGAANEPA